MTRTWWLLALICGVGCTTSGTDRESGQEAAPGRPNIILIMTDDQGVGDLSSGGNPVLETPRIDRLARESVSLTHFYVSPVCTPTRASLMTGRYNYRTRAIDTWVGRAMMDPEEVTIAEVLRDAGYRTGIFGKWHLGDCYPLRANDQGFQESLVHRGGGLAQPSEPPANARRYTDPILFRNGAEVATRGYCTDVYTDAAIEFIADSHRTGSPFFVYLAPNAPHGPFHDVPPELLEKYQGRDLTPVVGDRGKDKGKVARTFAMIENIDQNVGRLLDHVETLGLTGETIVIYLHDNGPATVRYNAGLRSRKSDVYEGGIRSPFLVRWTGHLEPRTIERGYGAHIDVFPTLLAATGTPSPDRKIDGIDLWPTLEGRSPGPPDRALFLQTHRGNAPTPEHHFAVREGRWKLLRSSGFGRWTPAENTPFELYDLEADPGETEDLAARHPEIVRRLRASYHDWFADVSGTRPDNYAPPRIVAGSDAERTTVLTRQDWRIDRRDGWGVEGEWLLTIEGEPRFEVEVLALKESDSPTATLEIGEREWKTTAGGTTRSLSFPPLSLSSGPTRLRVRIESGGQRITPHQVYLRRQ